MTDQNKTPIAVLGSPSSTTEMSLDILEAAAERKLVGSLVYGDLRQEGVDVRFTGQIVELEMRNSLHEQNTIKNAVKMMASIDGVSGLLDSRTASLVPGAVFGRRSEAEDWTYETLGTVPATGTRLNRLDQATLDDLVRLYERDLFRVGRAYGDDQLVMPMFLKHFGDPQRGGQGEAYHSLVVGKTGSGKSTLAKFMLAGYARHEDMAILVIDPKGEFADEISGYEVGASGLPFRGVLKGLDRATQRYGITQIRLETYEVFEDVLLSLGIDKDLNIRGADNKEELAKAIVDIVKKTDGMSLDDLRGPEKLIAILEAIRGPEEEDEDGDEDVFLRQIYKSKEPRDGLRKLINRIVRDQDHRIFATWDFLTYLFAKDDGSRPTISQLVSMLMKTRAGERPFIVIDLSVTGNRRDIIDLGDRFKGLQDANEERDLFTDKLQKKILYRIASDLRRTCETVVSERMRAGDRSNVNTLVVFEEAHRHVPKSVPSDDEDGKKLKAKLVEAVRETRKYGLGWFFIDQTVGGLDKEIIQQIRCAYLGFGLSMGEELNAVKEMVGGDPRDTALYRVFKDPASFGRPSDKKFPWMAVGPVSPMAANRPLFFNAFQGEEFVARNNLPVDRSDKPMRLPPAVVKGKKTNSGNTKSYTVESLPDDLF